MALPTKTLDQWITRALANFRTSFPGWPLGKKKFLGREARALGNLGWQLNKAVEDVDKDIVPSAQSSGDVLDEWAFTLGLPDGAGGYGRLKATTSSGGAASLTGVKGTVYPDEATAVAEDGTTQIKLSGSVTIAGSAPGFGAVGGVFVSVTTGTVANLGVGTRFTWDSPPAGADAKFTLTSELSGAVDLESNPDVFARIVQRLQTPPRGGVSEDYRIWSATVAGIIAWIYPKRSGTGTVDVVITQAGSNQARVPSAAQRDDVAAYILTKRPAAVEGASTILPDAPDGNGHAVRLRVTPNGARYAFDWDSSAASYTVDTGGYSAGPPATLRLNTLAPASLKAAIDSYIAGTGLAPRLQVMSTDRVINDPIRAISYSDGGGKTTLTLESVPGTWTAPVDGDAVHAYGPVVATVAAGVQALCNALGPSTASGFSDPLTPWNDTLTISGLIAVAESAIDTDGTELIGEVPVGYATIDGAVADVQGTDSSPTLGPELLYLSSVAVTP